MRIKIHLTTKFQPNYIYFSDNEKARDFGERMKKFGERMDREMKVRSEKLEARGNSVCRSIAALDTDEEELKAAVKDISQFNLIQMKKVIQVSPIK